MNDLERLLTTLCARRAGCTTEDRFDHVDAWRAFLEREVWPTWSAPIDRAVVGGFEADRLGYAFAAGYQSALSRLIPGLEGWGSLCVTEEGGGHPKAILATLEPLDPERADGALALTGEKRWATLAGDSGVLCVAASRGARADGRKALVVVQIPTTREGVVITRMPPTPFVPEVTHGAVSLRGVRVAPEEVLPGDGYTGYIKPFRTLEDTHVSAAVVGFMLRIGFAHGWPDAVVGELLQLVGALRGLGLADRDAPAVHVALDGAMGAMTRLGRGEHWASAPDEVRARWARDAPLMGIAARARQKRLERAWERLGGQ